MSLSLRDDGTPICYDLPLKDDGTSLCNGLPLSDDGTSVMVCYYFLWNIAPDSITIEGIGRSR